VRIESEDWALDLVVSDEQGRAVIGGEAKTSGQALDAMLDEVRFCVLEESCTHREHRKIVGLRREQPRFWAIRPGERRAFEISYRTSRLDLYPIEDIPTASPTA
jgi:hypothetical protein